MLSRVSAWNLDGVPLMG